MKNFVANFCFFALLCLLFVQCNEENETYWTPNAPVLAQTNVRGIVIDERQIPLAGVQITTFCDKTTTTNDFGFFQLDEVWAIRGKVAVKASKDTYFDKTYATALQGENTVMKILMSHKNIQSIASNTASEINMGNAKVVLPADIYANENGNVYEGTVKASYQYYDPRSENFQMLMPGGDFMGIDEAGENMLLISYGAMTVELEGENGEKLQLQDGQTATLRFSVPDDMLADAPTTIPLWHFDEEEATWIEEGSATLIGNEYVGEVSHFSSWNCDDPISPRTFVEGYVKDCVGNPLSGIVVTVGPVLVYTNEQGYYSTNTAVGLSFPVFVNPSYNNGLESQIIDISGLLEGEILSLDALVVECQATISGQIVDCEGNPTAGTVLAQWEGNNTIVTSSDGNFFVHIGGNEEYEVMITAVNAELVGSINATTVIDEIIELEEAIVVCTPIAECEPTEQIGIVQENPFNVNCENVCIYATGGIQYEWSNGTTTVLNCITATQELTTYTVTITTEDCVVVDEISVQLDENGTSPIEITTNTSNSTCGFTNGFISVNVSGGSSPYTYSWGANTGGQSTAFVSGLGAGNYNITVTDSNDCWNFAEATIDDDAALTVNIVNITDATCGEANGSMGATVTSGSAPYTYLWSDASNQVTSQVMSLVAGNYTITVTDSNGCLGVAQGTVNDVNVSVSFDDIPLLCIGEQTTLSPNINGGIEPYTYLWNTGAVTDNIIVSPSVDTTYNITVTDDNGCETTAEITVVTEDCGG